MNKYSKEEKHSVPGNFTSAKKNNLRFLDVIIPLGLQGKTPRLQNTM